MQLTLARFECAGLLSSRKYSSHGCTIKTIVEFDIQGNCYSHSYTARLAMDYFDKLKQIDPVFKILIGLGSLVTLYFGVFSWPFFLFIGAPVLLKIYLKVTCGKTNSGRRMDGKVIIVTGGNAGLGFETVKDLAGRGGTVIMACRNLDKGNIAKDKIKKDLPGANVSVMKLELSSMRSVREFAAKFQAEHSRLDVLVNNAGGVTMEKILTEDLETNFATNHFGSFLLTNLLLGLMKKTGKARVVMVTGEGHRVCTSFDLENLNSEKDFAPLSAGIRAALAKILFTRELDRRFRAYSIREITVNALHPGIVNTEIFHTFDGKWYQPIFKILQPFGKTTWEGAQTQIHLSVAEDVEELSGKYWIDCQESVPSKLAQDPKLAKDLWDRSVKCVGLKPDENIFEKME